MPACRGPSAAPESHAATLMPPVWEDRAFREGGGRTHREDSRGGGAGGVQCSQEVEGLGCEDLAAGFVETKAHPTGVSEGFGPSEPAGHSSLATGLQAPAQTCCSKPPGRGSPDLRQPGWKHGKGDSSRGQWFSKCGPQSSSISTTWALGRNAGSRAPPRPMNTGVLRNRGGGAQKLRAVAS